jgi:hypothetical protein
MVLKILATVVPSILPAKYSVHIIATITILLVAHAFTQGRKTTRERDLHARVILITVGSTPTSDGRY